MLKLCLIIGVLFCMAHAKQDLLICDISTIDQDPDFANNPLPSFPEEAVYRVDIESNKDGFTSEVKEYYDGKLNKARSSSLAVGLNINSYVYPSTKELLIVKGTDCVRTDLTDAYEKVAKETTFMMVNKDGKPKVVGGTFGLLDARKKYIEPSLIIKYTGNGQTVRGIPVKQWVACLYDADTDKTSKVTISYADTDMSGWKPAHIVVGKTVPVQVEITSKTGQNKQVVETHSILSYNVVDSIREEDLNTESGVYCMDRKNTKNIPVQPKVFSSWIQHSQPKANSFEMIGSVELIKSVYDFDRQLHSERTYVNDHEIKTVNDYNTRLAYIHDRNAHTCEIVKLNAGLISQASIFRFEEDPPYQYIGQRRVRGINTDVWIAVRDNKNMSTTWEWHFATDDWQIQESSAVTQNDPILLTITCGCDHGANVPKNPEYFHIVNYDKSKTDLYDFDVSECQKKVDNKHIRFEIKPEVSNYERMKNDQTAFRTALMEALLGTTQVNLLRIGGVETEFHNRTIFITFSLFDRPIFYGKDNVEEEDLETVEKKLSQSIADGVFTIQYNNVPNKVEKNSYILLEQRDGRYIYEINVTGETVNYTLGSVFAFLFVFLFVGIMAGVIIGYFAIIKRSEPLPAMPGPLSFLNPAYTRNEV